MKDIVFNKHNPDYIVELEIIIFMTSKTAHSSSSSIVPMFINFTVFGLFNRTIKISYEASETYNIVLYHVNI